MDTRDFENKRWEGMRQPVEFRHRSASHMVKNGTVLDVGCGDGLLLRMLKERGIEAEGTDLSEVAVEQCKAQGFAVTVSDFTEDLPYADNSFDTVIALDVLEHVYDPAKLLQNMKRVSNRYVLIGVPNFSSLPARLQVLRGRVPENNRPNKGHIYWFNWKVLSGLMHKNGLEITRVRVNAPWQSYGALGQVTSFLARTFPNLWALSFVIECEKRHG